MATNARITGAPTRAPDPSDFADLGRDVQSQARRIDALLHGAMRYVDDLASEPRGTEISAIHQHSIQVVDILLQLAIEAVAAVDDQGEVIEARDLAGVQS